MQWINAASLLLYYFFKDVKLSRSYRNLCLHQHVSLQQHHLLPLYLYDFCESLNVVFGFGNRHESYMWRKLDMINSSKLDMINFSKLMNSFILWFFATQTETCEKGYSQKQHTFRRLFGVFLKLVKEKHVCLNCSVFAIRFSRICRSFIIISYK